MPKGAGRDPIYGWDHDTRQSVQEFRKSAARKTLSASATVTFADTGGNFIGDGGSASSVGFIGDAASGGGGSFAGSASMDSSSGHTRSIREMEDDQIEIDEDNPIKLYTGPIIDTTDFTKVDAAEKARFDPLGFRTGQGLQRDLFYTDPYITCSNCNLISFVDVTLIRRMIALSANNVSSMRQTQHWNLPSETLPPCTNCTRMDCFVIGSQDFSEEIANRARLKLELEKLQWESSKKIQRAYRAYLKRMYGHALATVFRAGKYYKHVAAIRMSALGRGRLGRRRAATERSLAIIADCHPLIIKHSLRPGEGRVKVFWYYRQVEVALLFRNYIELVEKLGYVPHRQAVEKNIQEVARRCLARKNFLIRLVQKAFRGFLHRRMVKFLRKEVARLFQKSIALVMKIQRTYRAHHVRLVVVPQLRVDRQKERDRQKYLHDRQLQSLEKERQRNMFMVKEAYVKERAEERTARMTSRIESTSMHEGRKMKAFWASCYADDKLDQRIDLLQDNAQSVLEDQQSIYHAMCDRREFMKARVAETGPAGFGSRNKPRKKYHGLVQNVNPQNPLAYLTRDKGLALQVSDGKDHSGRDGKIIASSSSSRRNRNSLRETGAGGNDDESMSTVTEGDDAEGTFEWIECSRSAAFRKYFYDEQLSLVDKLVQRTERIKTDALTTKVTSRKHKDELKAYNIDNYKKQPAQLGTLSNHAADRSETDKLLNDIGMRALSGALTIADTADYQQVIDRQHQREAMARTASGHEEQLSPKAHKQLVHHQQHQHQHHHHHEPAQKKTVRPYKFPKGINVDAMAWLMDDGEVGPDL